VLAGNLLEFLVAASQPVEIRAELIIIRYLPEHPQVARARTEGDCREDEKRPKNAGKRFVTDPDSLDLAACGMC
jgi:hypothetical protein